MRMTQEEAYSAVEKVCEAINLEGVPGLREVMGIMLNMAMELERRQALKAAPYERTDEREGYANGYKDRTLHTRMGSVPVRVPQVRGISFYPGALERGQRSERALKAAVAEMYLQGVSTRKVHDITEALCGFSISSGDVSRVSKLLDDELNKWNGRSLGRHAYVYLDARYEKVRQGGTVLDAAVLWAVGVNESGHREVLGVSVSMSEAEVHWRAFLKNLKERGLTGTALIISDDHFGLKAARRTVFPGIKWQRCQFHMSQNAQAYVPRQNMRKEIAQDIRDIFNSPTLETARGQAESVVIKYKKTAPHLSKWIEENIHEGFTVYEFPRAHHKRIRTVNAMERTNREIRRRTRVATLFPNEESCLRLAGSILMEVHEEWITGRQYLDMKILTDYLVENEDRIYRKNVA